VNRAQQVERNVREIRAALAIDVMHWAARYSASVYLVGSTLHNPTPRDCDLRITIEDHDFAARYGMTIMQFPEPRHRFTAGVNWGYEPPTQRWVDDIAKFSHVLSRKVGNVDLQIWPLSYWSDEPWPVPVLLAAPSPKWAIFNRYYPDPAKEEGEVKLSTAAAALLALLLVGAGYGLRWWQDRPDASIVVSRDSLTVAAHDTDLSITRRRPGDSAAVAEPLHVAGVHLQHAVSLGDTVPSLQSVTDSALSRVAAADTLASRAIVALATERAAEQRQVSELRATVDAQQQALGAALAQVAYYRDTAVVVLQGQRDAAQKLLDRALASGHRSRCGPGAGVGLAWATGGHGAGAFVGMTCQL